MEVNIITDLNNKWGLSKDVKILQTTLHRLRVTTHIASHQQTPTPRKYANFHLEIISPQYFRSNEYNILIPNQEWFQKNWLRQSLLRFNETWTKTHVAQDIFTNLQFKNTKFMGYTSIDQYDPSILRKPQFFHATGSSSMKNTPYVISEWKNHPEYPMLHWYCSTEQYLYLAEDRPNLTCHMGRVTDEEIKYMQNESMWIIQPSASEGFGHCIMEALSTGNTVISLDAPPMNEYPVILSECKFVGYHNFGSCYVPTNLTDTIKKAMDSPQNNREAYLLMSEQFAKRVSDYIRSI